jgi:hypothetical protein
LNIFLVLSFDLPKMCQEWLLNRAGQHRDPIFVALAAANSNLVAGKSLRP